MPTYDYVCDSCGHTFEEFQSMSDDALETCPSCKKDSLRRVITGGTGVIFKGSGFYVNDSRGSTNPAVVKAKDSDTSDSLASNDAKPATNDTTTSDSKKPEKKTEKQTA